ncbi:MAG: lipid kinase [Bacteroidetes bacterium B1(2017)]|nr:MAG: lipid kinase [Bacteroidetes bacterium B1(2017)]
MADKKKVRFIINPISGGKAKKDIPSLLNAHLDQSKFDMEITFSQSGNHAKELAKEAVELNKDLVVAVGGDGTLNIVASCLVHTNTPMGIIPLGSGNGFARALNIPMNTIAAIQLLNTGKSLCIDSGSANGTAFINVCGFGFDAYVSSKFAEAGTRGLKTYARISIKELNQYKPKEYKLVQGLEQQIHKAFVLAICNGPQYGNNAYIAPLAEFADAWFDITLLKQVSWTNFVGLSVDLFLRRIHQNKQTNTQRVKDLIVIQPEAGYVNIDGEPVWFDEQVSIKMHPKSLTIIVP